MPIVPQQMCVVTGPSLCLPGLGLRRIVTTKPAQSYCAALRPTHGVLQGQKRPTRHAGHAARTGAAGRARCWRSRRSWYLSVSGVKLVALRPSRLLWWATFAGGGSLARVVHFLLVKKKALKR